MNAYERMMVRRAEGMPEKPKKARYQQAPLDAQRADYERETERLAVMAAYRTAAGLRTRADEDLRKHYQALAASNEQPQGEKR